MYTMIPYRYHLTFLALGLLLLPLLPQTSHSANETAGCHCFRNRTFNAVDKFSSDEYLLTTTFNSLLASEFNISKRQIIMLKMEEGVANDVLVTALYLAAKTGSEVSQLLKMKQQQPWQEIISRLKMDKTSSDFEKLLAFITPDVSDEQIAEYVTTQMIFNRFSPAPESVDLLRKKGLNSREIILVNTLADHTGTPAQMIAAQNRENGLSWSEIAHNFGLAPADVGKLLEPGTTAGE